MKLLQFYRHDPNVIDVTDVREISAKPHSKRKKLLLFSGFLVAVAGTV